MTLSMFTYFTGPEFNVFVWSPRNDVTFWADLGGLSIK